jgi:hypothetical protein
MSRLGAAFYAFALILSPVLAFVEVLTFLRLAQSSIEDLAYARRIALLRSFYLRLSPELEPYLAVVTEARSAKARSPGDLRPTIAGAAASLIPAPERQELSPPRSVTSDQRWACVDVVPVAHASTADAVALSRFALAIDKSHVGRSLRTCRDGPRTPTTPSTPRSRR